LLVFLPAVAYVLVWLQENPGAQQKTG
jgi:hypothetical protein